MELSHFFFMLHLLGALVSFCLIFKSLFALVSKEIAIYKKLSVSLWGGTVFQLITGGGMLFVSPEISFMSVCSKLGIYLGIIFLIQGTFYSKAQERSILPMKLD